MVSLPEGIRSLGLSPVHQLVRFAIGFGAVVSEGHKISRQTPDNVEDGSIAGSLLPKRLREPPHLTIQGCERKRRLLEGEAFDGFLELYRHGAALASILTRLAR